MARIIYASFSDSSETLRNKAVSTYLNKLRLDGGGMNALVVEESLHVASNAHIISLVATENVCRRDDAISGQLPNMELVHGVDPWHLEVTECIRNVCNRLTVTLRNGDDDDDVD